MSESTWQESSSGVQSGCLFPLQPTHLADFNQVQTIQYSNSEDKDRKGMLQLKIAGAPEVRMRFSWVVRIPVFSYYMVGVLFEAVMNVCPQEWSRRQVEKSFRSIIVKMVEDSCELPRTSAS